MAPLPYFAGGPLVPPDPKHAAHPMVDVPGGCVGRDRDGSVAGSSAGGVRRRMVANLNQMSHPLLGDRPTLQLLPSRTDIAGVQDHATLQFWSICGTHPWAFQVSEVYMDTGASIEGCSTCLLQSLAAQARGTWPSRFWQLVRGAVQAVIFQLVDAQSERFYVV